MITLYRSLSVTIAVLVGVQAGSHAWASAGLSRYIMGGAVVDKSMMEDTGGPLPFPEVAGILVHGLNGGIVIPAGAALAYVGSAGTLELALRDGDAAAAWRVRRGAWIEVQGG